MGRTYREGYHDDGDTMILLPGRCEMQPQYRNSPIPHLVSSAANIRHLRAGRDYLTLRVRGTCERYELGDAEAWAHGFLWWLANGNKGTLCVEDRLYPGAFFVSGTTRVHGGTGTAAGTSTVDYDLTFMQPVQEKTIDVSSYSGAFPEEDSQHPGRTAARQYTFGGTAIGLIAELGLSISIRRDVLLQPVPRCYGVRIEDRVTGVEMRFTLAMSYKADTHGDWNEWFVETFANQGDAPATLSGNGNDWPDCHLTRAGASQGADPFGHVKANNIELEFLLEDPKVNHNNLGNLEWSASGHTMDTDLPMASNNITGTGQDSAAAAKYRFAYFDNSGNLIEGDADVDDLTPPSGGGASALGDLSDVTITSVTTGDVLLYTGAGWENQTLAEADIAAASDLTSHTGTTSNPHSVTAAQTGAVDKTGDTMSGSLNMGANKIENVDDPIDDDDAATKKYVDDTMDTMNVDDINDVEISGTPADNELLAYDNGSSKWINQTAAEAGLASATHASNHTNGTDDIQTATFSQKGLMDASMAAKLTGVESGADVTDADNVNAAGATMNTDSDVSANSWVLDEDDMNSDDATKVPTQQSVKAYVDNQGGGNMTVEEYDGGAGGSADTLVFPVGTLASLGSNDYLLWPHGADDSYRPGGNMGVYGYAWLHTGQYTGDGLDKKEIAGYSGMPLWAVVKGTSTQLGVSRSMTMAGKGFSASTIAANRIIQVHNAGIRLGTDATVNTSAASYYHFGLGAAGLPGTGVRMAVGSYTGDATDDRTITTTGVNPDLVWIKRGGSNYTVWKSDQHTGEATSYFSAVADIASNAIQSLGAGQFTVGSGASVNSNGETYYWVAFEKAGTRASEIYVGEYCCDVYYISDEYFIPCPFVPDLLVMWSSSGFSPIWATSAMTMPLSVFFDGTANATTAVTEMAQGGFHVGNSSSTQYAARQYGFLAMKASTS